MKQLSIAAGMALALVAALSPMRADAAGCLKGAAIGGVAGHMAGHHALLGAAAGCAVGHHEAARHAREDRQQAARDDRSRGDDHDNR